ncbi:MAG: magnesium transporter, partial [Bacteroides sp.]
DDVEQAGNIVDLLKYDEDTAGGLMATEMVKVNENLSMPECLKEMRLQAEELNEIHYVYVVDDDDRLQGVFPLKKVITSPSVSKVKHVMKKDPIAVQVNTPIDEVAQTIEKYDLVALPVLDSIGRLVGIITVDDVMDEIREQAEKDYQLASGLSQDVETDDNIFKQTRARLPWLIIGMIGGMCNSVLIEGFEATLTTEMSYYIPLIGGTGGNVGTQSSALVVQGLANSSLTTKETLKHVSKEAVVALVNATIISMLVYIFNFFRFGPTAVITYSVSLSLFSVVMFASIFGTLVPMTLEKLKIDPAIATGPFIAITNDIVGMMFYMVLTRLLS